MYHNFHLIQRGRINKPFALGPLSKAVNQDYMGSSEFEFNALPTSLAAMHAKAEDLRIVHFFDIKTDQGQPLIGYGVFSETDIKEYSTLLTRHINGHQHTKERTGLSEAIRPLVFPGWIDSKEQQQLYLSRQPDFWWDIENHVMFSFDVKFMVQLGNVLRQSWAKMQLSKIDDQEVVLDWVKIANSVADRLQAATNYSGEILWRVNIAPRPNHDHVITVTRLGGESPFDDISVQLPSCDMELLLGMAYELTEAGWQHLLLYLHEEVQPFKFREWGGQIYTAARLREVTGRLVEPPIPEYQTSELSEYKRKKKKKKRKLRKRRHGPGRHRS